jgi:hypothetical protein
MARLNWKQLLFAVALGVVFATLQGDPPVHALARLSSVACRVTPVKLHC